MTDLMSEFGRKQSPAASKAPEKKNSSTPNKAAEEGKVSPKVPRPQKETETAAKAPVSPKKEKAEGPALKKEKTADKKPSGKSGTSKKATDKQEKKPTDKKTGDNVQASTATPKADRPAKKEKPENTTPPSQRPGHRILPYVIGALAVFLLVCLVLNLFCNAGNRLENTPEKHWMGPVGYHVCYVLSGMFGGGALSIPLLLGVLALTWRKSADRNMLTVKLLTLVFSLLLLSALIHVIGLTDPHITVKKLTSEQLMFSGVKMGGGGILGGMLGYLFYSWANFTGGILISALLFGLCFFIFLGLTPARLWSMIGLLRAKKREKKEKSRESLSLSEAENAKYRAEMDEKFRRAKGEQLTIDDRGDGFVDGVRVVDTKKVPRDHLAPMPTPRLDPNDGSRPFIPSDVNRKLREGAPAQAVPAAGGQRSATGDRKPAAAPEDSAHSNRDVAIDPIFPKGNESRQNRRIPKEERNFDLKNIFIDLEDSKSSSTPRKHADVPPEVPMAGGPRPVQKPMTAGQKSAPSTTSAPTPTPTPTTGSRTVPAGQRPVPPSVGGLKKPSPTSPGKINGPSPVFRQADKKKQEFGLNDEEFEKLEAEKNGGRPAPKKPAPKAPSKKKPESKPQESEQKYVFPPVAYLHPGEPMTEENRAEIEASMQMLAQTLSSFNVRVQEINYSCGPTVTRYEVILAPGVRVRTVTNLSNDIALALRSPGGVRIEAPIPGTNAVGIEVPNKTRSTIYLRDLIENREFTENKSKLTACLGSDIAGQPIYFDISKMPHLLIAGTTGSGKSVCINCIIMSLLYKVRPDEVKLVLVDPKKVEFSIYKNIPHLMAPVVTLPKDAAGALQASVEEMERRFEVFESVGVRDIKGYNEVTADDPDMPFMPHIVIIIDELADLMMTAKNEVETAICRIAQKARAAGMHLIIGTQRPSADVVTGLIKANVPSSIAFAVKSQIDSRVILDHGGAEALTGKGDMLFVPIGSMRDTRIQGAFVSDKEVEKICEFIRAANGTAQYDEKFITKLKELAAQCGKSKGKSDDLPPVGDGEKVDDPKYNDAVRVAIEEGRISTSLLQRKLEIGYSRAAKIIDRMQAEGIVSPPDGSKPRSILISKDEYMEKFFGEDSGSEEA